MTTATSTLAQQAAATINQPTEIKKKPEPEVNITPIVMNALSWGLYTLYIIDKPDPLNFAALALTEFAANRSTVEIAKKINGKAPQTSNKHFVIQLAGSSMGAAAVITSICAANHFGFEVSRDSTSALLYVSSLKIAGICLQKLLGSVPVLNLVSPLVAIPLIYTSAPIMTAFTINQFNELELPFGDQCWDLSLGDQCWDLYQVALGHVDNIVSTTWSLLKLSAIISGVTLAASALEVKISSMLSENNKSKIWSRINAHPRLKNRIEAYLDIADTTPLKNNDNDLKTLVRTQVHTRLNEQIEAILDIADNTSGELKTAELAEDKAIEEIDRLEKELLDELAVLGLLQKTGQSAA